MERYWARSLATVVTLLFCTPLFATTARIPGHFGVSPIGTAQYSIPIWTPPGPRGIQPNLSLFYDSGSHIGPLGIGWSIGGLGSITRCNKTIAQDTTAAPVALVASDGYCINGNRLRLTSGTYGAAGSTYQTEIADFSNITAYGAAGNGPAYFTVQGRDGLTYQYGYTDTNGNGVNSEVIAKPTSTALTWMLSKVIDRAGNNYVIDYMPLNGTAVPSKILWTPTAAGASSYTYSMVFNYTSNLPQSSVNKYVGGTLVSNTELLSSIAIYDGTTAIRDYILAYQASASTGRNELKTLTECTDSTKSACLLPTTVTYDTGTAGVSLNPTTALNNSGAYLTARYDLNGDGYPDLVYNPTGTGVWYVAFGSASGYGAPVNTQITGYALIGRLTGGNQDSLLVNNGGTWWSYTYDGAKFPGASTEIHYDTASYGYQLADINGDGLPDLIELDVTYNAVSKTSKATISTSLNTSSGRTVSFKSPPTPAYSVGGIQSAQLQTPDTQYGSLRRYDFNGDGLDDLVLTVIVGANDSFTLNTYELIANGTSFTSPTKPIASASGSTYTPVFFTNWNDDRCTDFVSSTTLYVSGCDGSVPETYTIGTVVAAMDWDGDGRTDLVVANGSTGMLDAYLSTGTAPSSPVPTKIPYSSTCQYVTMDANGDGLDDLGCWSRSGSSPISYYLHNGVTDLAASFTDGYGNSAAPTYTSINQGTNYFPWNDQVFPYENYIGSYYEVNAVTFSDPTSATGGTYYIDYYYAGASMNLQGRGFAGFGAMQTFDSRSGIWDTRNYSRAFPYTGTLNYEHADLGNSSTQSIKLVTITQVAETLDSTANNERYFPYSAAVAVNDYEVGAKIGTLITTTNTTYGTPDAYGNFPTVTSTVTDEDSGSPNYGSTYISTVGNSITPNIADWCLNLPSQTTVAHSGTGVPAQITRTTSYTPDYPNCRETGKVTEPLSKIYQVTEAYTFDSFGNLYTDTVTGIGMAPRETTLTWGTTGQFLASIKNPLSQTIYVGFDPDTGMKASQTDLNYTSSNPLTTKWLYDGFARKTKETRPDGTSTTWAYNPCGCGAVAPLTVVEQVWDTGGNQTNVMSFYYDKLDRQVSQANVLPNGTWAWSMNRQFDSLGRVLSEDFPFLAAVSPPGSQTYTYDVLNRVTQLQRPISASNSRLQTTTIGYSGRTTTTTDALSNTTTKISLITGSVARSIDAKGYYQIFAYDAFGSLLLVKDSAANTLFTSAPYAYGISAFSPSTTDMDLGSRSYTYDALGDITQYSDAMSPPQSFSMTYDALSRPLVRSEPDLVTTWTWGATAADYNIGRLHSVTSEDPAGGAGTYSDVYGYDSQTRLSTNTKTLPGDTAYTYTYTYSPTTGLLNTLQYPVSTGGYQLELGYGYSYGVLTSVNDTQSGTVYWAANALNPRWQVTEETLGNGVIVNRGYDAVTGWLGSIGEGVGGGVKLRNLGYSYDEMGNVTEQQDDNQGLTEDFHYDSVYRLNYSTLTVDSVKTTNLQIAYDTAGMGNIVSRSDVAGGATWTYDSTRKHAVIQAGSGTYSYSYDGNGNASTRNGYPVYWSSYNYPTGISTATESLAFQYGPDRQRWQTVYSGPSGTETTYHVGKLLEKVASGGVIDYRHYIFAGNELVAIASRQSTGTDTLHYVLKDQQGGISAIVADSTPGPVVDTVWESFTAYGNRRNGQTWSGPPTIGDETTINGISRWGYTGQTNLGASMGLIHMNGRVADSITGRFLSPDPNIPDPGNTQSYNRYTYVNNNPLTRTDPTGFTPNGNCNFYCPEDLHWSGGASGTESAGGFGGNVVEGNAFDDLSASIGEPTDLQSLTNWYNSASSAISDAFNGDSSGGATSGGVDSENPASGGTSNDGTTLSAPTAQSSGLAQSQQDPTQGQSQSGVDPSSSIPEIVVNGTRFSGNDVSTPDTLAQTPDVLDQITVMGNKGERGWQGTNPNPAKGVQPIRDSNGKIVGWSVRDPQTGKRTGKSLEWGRQNGLDPNNFFSPDDQLPTVPPLFGIPSLNPWWWLLFSAPAQ